jgi:hypothetical protein
MQVPFRARHASRSWWSAAAGLALVATAALAGFGCNSTTAPATTSPYLADTSAENTIANVATAFGKMDSAELAAILPPEFAFRFMPADVGSGSPDSLTQEQFLNALGKLFAAKSPCSASKIALTITPVHKQPDVRPGHDGWKHYTVNAALVVTYQDGNQISVNSPLEMYLRQTTAGSNHWLLAEWQDEQGSTGAPWSRVRPASAGAPTSSTWGHLLAMLSSSYCNTPAAPTRR